MNSNVPNDGRLITNLSDDAAVEVPCHVDRTGVLPCTIGDVPPQLATLNRSNVNAQSLAVDAALERDEDALRRALKLDPLTGAVCTLGEIGEIIDDLLEADAEYVSEHT